MSTIRIESNEVATANSLRRYVGQRASLRVDSKTADPMYFEVSIIDARKVYDLVHLRVMPVAGSGTQWVGLSRISNLHWPERKPAEVVTNG